MITVDDREARVTFDRYDLDVYQLFLRVKRLPEQRLSYDWRADAYTIATDARFAPLLAPGAAGTDVAPPRLAPHLFDYQAWIVARALDARRFAIWADTGLGKTAMLLEWARQVRDRTGQRVLILSPLSVVEQTRGEWTRFYDDELLPIARLDTREALAEWCSATGFTRGSIGISNYEKLIPGVLPELRRLGGLVLDESSILKSGGGTIKWNLIKSARGIEYKLSCTATPAPNDTMEYASQAAFLEKLRNEGDILWTYFSRDKRGVWRVKPHAREAFYRFMASWSIYLRDPARFGFTDILSTLPPPVVHEHRLPLTEEQRAAADEQRAHGGRGLFDDRIGVRERSKLAQIARGFVYTGPGPGRAQRIASEKPRFVADLVRREVAAGRPTIVWTVFDEETAILEEQLDGLFGERPGAAVPVAVVTGTMRDDDRAAAVARFLAGDADVLISKPQLLGYGLNLQHAKAMVFSGIEDSFERTYQAIRRAYRFGQTEPVHVHFPFVPELEGLILSNIRAKDAKFMESVAEQERHYLRALQEELTSGAAA